VSERKRGRSEVVSGMNRGTLLAVVLAGATAAVATFAFSLFRNVYSDEAAMNYAAGREDNPPPALNPASYIYLHGTRLLASLGLASAQVVLGARYQYAQGYEPDLRQALLWYRKSANQNNPTAQLFIGRLYYDATAPSGSTRFDEMTWWLVDSAGVKILKEDDIQARNWFLQAATLGNVAAQLLVAEQYERDDRKDDRNDSRAAYWYRKAADQGNAIAERHLGDMYVGVADENNEYTSWGVEQDTTKGIEWLTKAANQGDVDAQISLGMEYEQGPAEVRDQEQAAKWYLKAAERGNELGERDLGEMYAKGLGVPRDYVRAYRLLSLAAAKEAPNASEERDQLESIMTPAQLQEAQRESGIHNQ